MTRNNSIDIAKGILIFLVVLGHAPEGSDAVHKYIYWFHMPAFFVISGLFLRETFCLREEVKKKALRLLVPYLVFSIVIGTVARHGNIVKQTVGTLMGGNGNITSYTFPYYFLTVLFLASVLIYAVRKYSARVWVWTACGYLAAHALTLCFAPGMLGWIPWNADMALCMALFLLLGNKYRTVVLKNGGVFVPQHVSCSHHARPTRHYRLSV